MGLGLTQVKDVNGLMIATNLVKWTWLIGQYVIVFLLSLGRAGLTHLCHLLLWIAMKWILGR